MFCTEINLIKLVRIKTDRNCYCRLHVKNGLKKTKSLHKCAPWPVCKNSLFCDFDNKNKQLKHGIAVFEKTRLGHYSAFSFFSFLYAKSVHV